MFFTFVFHIAGTSPAKYKDDLMKSLDQDNTKNLINIFKNFLKYNVLFGKNISEVESFFTDIENSLLNKFCRITSSFSEIETVENAELILKAFENFSIFMEFKNDLKFYRIF